MPKFRPTNKIALIITLLALSGVFYFFPKEEYKLTRHTLTNNPEHPLQILILEPLEIGKIPKPAVVICQPFNNPPEFSIPLARALVRHGYIVLTFDWKGNKPNENRQWIKENLMALGRSDVKHAVEYLLTLDQVQPDSIHLLGHSVGGTLVMDVLSEPSLQIVSVSCIGMEADAPENNKARVQWVIGLYDEFRPLGTMTRHVEAQKAVHHKTGLSDTLRLAVSPTADHLSELLDAGIHKHVLDWVTGRQVAFIGLPDYRENLRSMAFTVCILSIMLLIIGFAYPFFYRYLYLFRILVWAYASILFYTTFASKPFFMEPFTVSLGWMAFILIGNMTAIPPSEMSATLYKFIRVGSFIFCTVVLTLIFNAVPSYAAYPEALMWLPFFIVKFPLDLISGYLFSYFPQILFSTANPDYLCMRWPFIALLAIEGIFPGALTRLLGLIRAYHKKALPGAKTGKSRSQLLVLLVLGIVLGLIGLMRFNQGFINTESVFEAGTFVFRYGVLGFFVGICLWHIQSKIRAS